MFRSLLAAVTLSLLFTSPAHAGGGDRHHGKSGGSSSSRGSGKAAPAQHHPAPDNSSRQDAGRAARDNAGRDSSGRDTSGRDSAGNDGRSDADRSTDNRAPTGRDDAGKGEAGKADVDRSGEAARTAGPYADHGAPSPSGARRLDTAHPADGVRGDHSVQRNAPSNYRGVYRGSANNGSRSTDAERVRHSSETARAHRNWARAHDGRPGNDPSRRGHSYVHHEQAEHWRNNWAHHHHGRSVWYRPGTWYRPWYPGAPRYWYTGVFVYGPGPRYAAHGGGGGHASAPERTIDHAGEFSLGVRGGSYLSGYTNGASYGDFGLGLAARYRPVDALGLELQWNYHDDTWSSGTDRIQQPLSASVELFAFPWTRVNPYVLGGVTLTGRNVNDQIDQGTTVSSDQSLWGPHIGAGLELDVSQKVSVNFDVRAIGYLNRPQGDAARPGAAQANMGLNFYF